MLTTIIPKLPMRSKPTTRDFYINQLGFTDISTADFEGYLLVKKDNVEIHFFEFKEIDPKENYSGVYIRTDNIEDLYKSFVADKINIHPNGALASKPWGQKEFFFARWFLKSVLSFRFLCFLYLKWWPVQKA